jgi:hypothetical protein
VIQLILFLGVGALLLISLFLLARRGPQAEGGAEALLEARKALSSLQGELLPTELVSRIFALDDLDYVTSSTSEDVRALFLAERQRIARSWVKQLRRQIVRLRNFHLGSARLYARLNFRTELTLAMEFAILLFACGALDLALRIRGPYGAQRIVDTTTAAAARVCEISEKSLGFLRPGSASPFGNPPTARNSAAL